MTGNTLERAPMSNDVRGFIFALSAFLMWGFLPLYMKLVTHIPASEVVAHRIVWSVPVAAILLFLMGRTADITAALRSPRTLMMACVTAGLITFNWGIYVWAISVDRALETALGYYINPLINVVLGALFLKERLNRAQMVAVGLALAAVILLTVKAGGLPWVSLALALSFGFYGFLRKTLPIGPSQGFMLEVLILSIPALGYILWLVGHGQDHFAAGSAWDVFILLMAGPVTAVPLICYAFGAKLLRYTTIGIMQYIGPTIIFLIAVFWFKEPFSTVQFVAFALIWAGLAIYTWSSLAEARKKGA
ncbi:EamA family transporter RarD [Mesorhizobium sp. RMAD-H1]|uniref:EamA family transporter RarD n=1 Tax=Mesorhizobium sp. RMAD-H1 TaxID=2587065 RepID=UPI0016174A0A|nr:EamA family transporter RarD [Mesorhizobium sp. RMAD-H1]MBB2970252.1 chloramphenicol-sensitive protein RarD [Mesorhizobium sp. RMAD-H1]